MKMNGPSSWDKIKFLFYKTWAGLNGMISPVSQKNLETQLVQVFSIWKIKLLILPLKFSFMDIFLFCLWIWNSNFPQNIWVLSERDVFPVSNFWLNFGFSISKVFFGKLSKNTKKNFLKFGLANSKTSKKIEKSKIFSFFLYFSYFIRWKEMKKG